MKDAELIYSLYVQANPVPDPDLLPLTRDEAVLLTLERSPDMTTQERLDTPQPTSTKGRLVPALGIAVVLVAAVAAVAILMRGDSGPVVAEEATPIFEFDGTSCSYEGPTVIEEGMVTFAMTNTSDDLVNFATIRMEEPELSQALEVNPVGTDFAVGPDELPAGELRFVQVSPNASWSHTWAMAAGDYLVDCATGEAGATDHIWRAGHMEVVAP